MYIDLCIGGEEQSPSKSFVIHCTVHVYPLYTIIRIRARAAFEYLKEHKTSIPRRSIFRDKEKKRNNGNKKKRKKNGKRSENRVFFAFFFFTALL